MLVKCMRMVKVVTVADHKSFKYSQLQSGTCYEVEICVILPPFRFPMVSFYPNFFWTPKNRTTYYVQSMVFGLKMKNLTLAKNEERASEEI